MYAEVVFPLPFRNTFTYSIPKELNRAAKAGVRAVAPFGKRTLTGFIINKSSTTEVKGEIKPLTDILDETPIFNANALKFYKWLADYYMCSLGEALRLSAPYGTDIESKRMLRVNDEKIFALLSKEEGRRTKKEEVLKILSEREVISLSYLQKAVGKKNIYAIVKEIEEEGGVVSNDELTGAKVRAKEVKFVEINKPVIEIYEAIPELEEKAPAQVKILLELMSRKKGVALAELLKKTESSQSGVNSLVKKGLIKVTDKEIDRRYEEEYKEKGEEFKLTAGQRGVLKEVEEELVKMRFQPFLLHGVTGSGKTQVYIELVKEAVKEGKSALILVPEISLTPQMTARMIKNFGKKVSVIHSRMSIGERYDSWRRILREKVSIVIGARSALFAPINNLGLIVVDEEHDASYKQYDVPKYNARDAAIILARFNDCPIILGSATPSIESMYNAKTGKYKLLELKERVDGAKLPKIEYVNVKAEKKKRKMENIFSKKLLEKIEDRLKKKEGVIILQNRRGFSTQIYCEDCSEVETCENCSVPMVFHINNNTVQCHYCNLIKKVPNACRVCGSINIKYLGTGTERVEDELDFYFPDAVIKRIDSDSISKKGTLSKILVQFAEGEIDILAGTQMVSKGMDFPRVTLVGVISAETSLWMPDFRADERTFQLLTQVAGRAGRSNLAGEVVIQTQNEDQFALQKVLFNDYEGFYQKEISDREKLAYPPFVRICIVEAKDKSDERAKGAIEDFYNELIKFRSMLKISDPATAMIAKLKGFYRYQITIKSSRITDPGGGILRKGIIDSYIEFNRKSRFSNVKIIIDVDPQSLM
jgi:primosomal protein N' (replication factor Y) (superfamily II helicase)